MLTEQDAGLLLQGVELLEEWEAAQSKFSNSTYRPKTPTQRSQDFLARAKQAGLVRFSRYVTPDVSKKLSEYLKTIVASHG